MQNFCTLFNIKYFTRGLAMYESLKKYAQSFHLYIFAFDDECYALLKNLNLEFVTVISLLEFEDPELLRVKPTRSSGEYCWTCTPSTILYVIEKFEVDMCTYVDADIYFFSSPQIIFDELGYKSVLITDHRYTKIYDQSATSGKYCVQFISFRNNNNGLDVLKWWRKACLDWCYAKCEDGKFGDQKYLDDWVERFLDVHSLEYLGGGLAPWNIQQYKFLYLNNELNGIEKKSNEEFKVIFYHFHDLKFYKNWPVQLTGAVYFLPQKIKNIFYKPYLNHLNIIYNKIKKIDNDLNINGITYYEISWKAPFRLVKRVFNDLNFVIKEAYNGIFN